MSDQLDKSISDFLVKHPIKRGLYYSNYAMIIGHYASDTTGAESVYYEWEGPESGVVPVSYEFFNARPCFIKELPWKLVEIGNDPDGEVVYFQREEFANKLPLAHEVIL